MKISTRYVSKIFLWTLLICAGCAPDPSQETSTEESNGESRLSLLPLTGTLIVKPIMNVDETSEDYWIYIDRVLVQAGHFSMEPFQVQLLPGHYSVEVAISDNSSINIDFPFTFQSSEARVVAEDTATVELVIDQRSAESVALGFLSYSYDTWDDWYNRLRSRTNATLTDLQSHKVILALNDVMTIQPLNNSIYLNLPDAYGGGREFDSRQVRIIVEWLQIEAWSWFPDLPYGAPEEVSRAYGDLSSVVGQSKNAIAQYSHIAQKLEQVRD